MKSKITLTTTLVVSLFSLTTFRFNYNVDCNEILVREEENAINALKDSGENVYYAKASSSDFIFSSGIEVYSDETLSEDSKVWELATAYNENDSEPTYVIGNNNDFDYKYSIRSAHQIQDANLIEDLYSNTNNTNSIDLFYNLSSDMQSFNLVQNNSYGSDYNLINIQAELSPSGVAQEIDNYWIALELEDDVDTNTRDYLANYSGDPTGIEIEYDEAIEDIYNSELDYSTPKGLDLVYDVNSNIYSDSLNVDGINSVKEIYSVYNDDWTFDLWNNSFKSEPLFVSKILINSENQFSNLSGNAEQQNTFYQNLYQFLDNEFGENYSSLVTNDRFSIEEMNNEDGTFNYLLTFKTNDENVDQGKLSKETTDRMSDGKFDYSKSYIRINDQKDSKIIYSDSEAEFEKHTPTSKTVFIVYIVLLTLLIIGLALLYIFRRRK